MRESCFPVPQGGIHYWRGGAPGAPALVFLPGLTADRRLFGPQLAFFAAGYDLLVWDAPGHGASRPFRLDFTLADMAAWLRAILAREGIEAPVLIGQSMGGYLAQSYMALYPGAVRGFVSIDSAPLQRQYYTAAELWLLKRCEPIYRFYPWEALIRAGARGCAQTPAGRALMEEMMRSYTPGEYSRLAGYGYRLLAQAAEAAVPRRLGSPALLLCGERDRAGSSRRYNRRWSREEGLPLIWIPGAGHNSNTDAPQAVNEAIEEFLRGLFGPQGSAPLGGKQPEEGRRPTV